MAGIITAAASWLTAQFITVTGITSLAAAQAFYALTVVAISAGLYEAGQALQPGGPSPSQQKQTIRQAVAARMRYYGEVKVGGVYAFLDDKSSFLYQLIMVNSGEIDSFVTHWLADQACVVDGSGAVTSPAIYTDSSGGHFAFIDTVQGAADQASFARLMAAFPGEWTSAHQLKGVSCVLVSLLSPEAKYFANQYPGGLPQYNGVLHASKVWDPRDGAQSADDPSTWTWTQNGVLIVLDYLWHNDGMRLPRAMLEAAIDVWKAQADIADEVVDTKDGGTEPRYRLSGGYDLTQPPKSVLPSMLTPMDAQLFLRGDGGIIIDVGRFIDPTVTLFDGIGGSIVDYSGLATARDAADLRNQITSQFVAPAYNFVEQDADPWQDLTSIDLDGLQSLALDQLWSPSHPQTRRRMKVESYRQNPGWSGQIVTNAYGLRAIDQRFVRVQIPELDIDDVFEVQKFSFDIMSGQCTIQISVMPAEAYAFNPATEEGTAPDATSTEDDSAVEEPADLAATASSGILNASWSAPQQPSLSTEADSRVHNGSITDAHAVWTPMLVIGLTASSAPLATDHYDVRVRFIDPSGSIGAYAFVRNIGFDSPSPPEGTSEGVTD